jgi:hypothetical protein
MLSDYMQQAVNAARAFRCSRCQRTQTDRWLRLCIIRWGIKSRPKRLKSVSKRHTSFRIQQRTRNDLADDDLLQCIIDQLAAPTDENGDDDDEDDNSEYEEHFEDMELEPAIISPDSFSFFDFLRELALDDLNEAAYSKPLDTTLRAQTQNNDNSYNPVSFRSELHIS